MKQYGASKPSETDWERIDAMTDDDIDFSDIPPLTQEQLDRMELVMPKNGPSEVEVKISVDPLVAAWYDLQGEDRDRRLRAALRLYATAHRV
jgi:hypothetical protein